MSKSKSIKVHFNEEMVALYSELVANNSTSRKFNDFVRDAYHDKIDELRTAHGSN